MSRRGKALLALAALLATAAIVAAALHFCKSCSRVLPWSGAREAPPVARVTYKDTELYELERISYRRWLEKPKVSGGGLEALDEGFLLATGEGRLYSFREKPERDGLDMRELSYKVPLNAGEFEAGARRILGGPAEFQWFRVADLLVLVRGTQVRLLVSHHYWKRAEQCSVLRVSMLEGTREQLLASQATLAWRTLFDSAPCIKLNVEGPRGSHFAGLEVGGRLAVLDETSVLLSVGDHEFDGWNRLPALSQDASSSYGKIVQLHLGSGASEIYSSGHRNPQGLALDASGAIWSTEHGPRGGDEVNLIRRGADYGWPAVTYGTEYSMHQWPDSAAQGRHEGYAKPAFAYVPSAGISQLAVVRGALFGAWKGDLLVGFLKGNRLERLRIEDGRAIYSEPITLSRRIRDVIEAPDGRIVVWSDEGDIDFLSPSMRRSGEALVFQCTGCHALHEWEPSTVGPRLWEVVGRDVASLDDFEYSEALKSLGGEWTRARLDAFLANPRGVAPGTTMQFGGMSDATERASLLDYLESLEH